MAIDESSGGAVQPDANPSEMGLDGISKAAAGYGQGAPLPKAKGKAAHGGAQATAMHPLFQKAAANAENYVFESSSKERAGPITANVEEASQTVFESQPSPGVADVSSGSQVSLGKAARSLIDEAADAIVCESKPRQRVADTAAADRCVAPSESRTVFESQPAASTADVACTGTNPGNASNAEELIHSAAERWASMGSDSAGIVFESVPKESVAQVTSSAPVTNDNSTSVFESKPSQSKADVTSSTMGHAASAKAVIEKAAEAAELAASSDSKNKSNSSVNRVLEAQAVIQAAASHAEKNTGFVFESKPVQSKAQARHGEVYSSSGEEETDDEA